jgi:hypothetical protein
LPAEISFFSSSKVALLHVEFIKVAIIRTLLLSYHKCLPERLEAGYGRYPAPLSINEWL